MQAPFEIAFQHCKPSEENPKRSRQAGQAPGEIERSNNQLPRGDRRAADTTPPRRPLQDRHSNRCDAAQASRRHRHQGLHCATRHLNVRIHWSQFGKPSTPRCGKSQDLARKGRRLSGVSFLPAVRRAYESIMAMPSPRRLRLRWRRPQGALPSQCRRREVPQPGDGAGVRRREPRDARSGQRQAGSQRRFRPLDAAFGDGADRLARNRRTSLRPTGVGGARVAGAASSTRRRWSSSRRRARSPICVRRCIADVKARLIGEIDKDLTKHPVWEIEKLVLG